MTCTECSQPIPFEEDVSIQVVYADERGIQRHCKHNPFDEADPAIRAILGSQDCVTKWLSKNGGTSVN